MIVETVNVEMDVVAAVIVISVTKTTIRLVRRSVVAKIHLVIPTRSHNTRSILLSAATAAAWQITIQRIVVTRLTNSITRS